MPKTRRAKLTAAANAEVWEIAMDNETRPTPEPESTPPVSETPGAPQAQPQQPAPPPPPQAQYQYRAAGPQTAPPTAPQPPRRSYWVPVGIGLGAGCLLLVLGFILMIAAPIAIVAAIGGGGTRGGNMALIRVSGTITGGKSSSGILSSGSAGAEDLVSQLERARKDKDIKAVLLRINSPGGSAAGSEEVWHEIMRVREDKPVYASMADVAASGGYYIASACDRIYADAATLTGSIGVIFSTADMSELYKKIGFSPEVVKSGKYKDMGSPARPLTPEERALLKTMIMNIYGQFVDAVAEGRKLPVAKVKAIADGRVFTGDQALKLKLIDEIGGMHDAVKAAGKAGRIKGEPKLVEFQRKGPFGNLLGSDDDTESQIDRAVTRQLINELVRQGAGGLANTERAPGM